MIFSCFALIYLVRLHLNEAHLIILIFNKVVRQSDTYREISLVLLTSKVEDPDERPIVGERKSLSCYNYEENRGNPEAEQNDVRWIHNDQIVRNDARHEGASTRVIKYY